MVRLRAAAASPPSRTARRPEIAPLLDIELVELDRACCTGAGVIAEHNQELADTLNARTFALASRSRERR